MAETDKVKLDGVLAKGYGIVPKLVMQDEDLTAEAKAIYSYICSYAGAGDTAFPSVSLMSKHLGMSEKRIVRHRKQLEEKGYITIHRKRVKEGFSNNIYKINHLLPVQNVPVQNVPVQNVPVQNVPTNNNSFNNNSSNNNKDKKEDLPTSTKKKTKHKYGANNNVLLTDDEHKKLKDKFGDTLNSRIDDLSFYIGSTGKKYKSHYLTILSWARKDEEKEQPKQKASSMPYADEYLKQFDWWEG